MIKSLKVMILAGEASGDLHGAKLAEALKDRSPGADLLGMGGSRMAAAGVRLVFDPTRMSTIGYAEALKQYAKFRAVQRLIFDALDAERPDVVVLIDYSGFNLTVAERAQQLQIPVVYYICPAVWAVGGEKRAKRIADRCTELASIFPFEAEIYRKAGGKVTFVGHPLMDVVPLDLSRDTARERLGVPAEVPLIGLLPGSRVQEIQSLLPAMAGAAEAIARSIPAARFLIPLAPTIERSEVWPHLGGRSVNIEVHTGMAHEVMAASDVLVAASGTATLEAAILGTPMVIVYRVSLLTEIAGRLLVKVANIGLPNVVAGRRVVPELLQREVNPGRIAREVLAILGDASRAAEIRSELARVRGLLGEPGAVERAADLVIATAQLHLQGKR